ncbi:MAG: carotenoid biosynthesis protein, partial [Myxococcota bacterium]|nr:carotenoid biosynthesis protein [Myxococcota bacterium]
MDARELVAISDPLSRPLHFVLLELAVLACTLAVLAHAVRAYRSGDRRHLFQWLVLTSYGVQMELIAFNFLHNYEHAQFTVQLYGGQLPLYVTGLYGTFMYTGLKVAERLRAHPLVEALLAGFAMCLIDVPFDVAGVSVGWWRWLDTDPNLAFRWLGVPVTSYYWYLIFGAVAALLCRALWSRLEARSFALAAPIAIVAGFGIIVFGVLGFLPFHAVAALGVSHGAIVAAHLVGCAVLALASRGRRERLDPVVAAVALG